MSFKAESNSELTVIVPAYQLHFRYKTKYTNKTFCPTPGPPYLAVLLVVVIFCPLGPTVRRISKSLMSYENGTKKTKKALKFKINCFVC